MTTDWLIFFITIPLNLVLLGVMCHRCFWQDRPTVFVLQVVLFLETPLYFLHLTQGQWNNLDQLNILLVMMYARSCVGICNRLNTCAALMILYPFLVMFGWCDVSIQDWYQVGWPHYAAAGIDILCTLLMIWSVYAFERKEGHHAHPPTPEAPTRFLS